MTGSNPAVPDVERDLLVVEALASDLKPYLTGKTLYWPLSPLHRPNQPLPPGTLGGVLFRVHRLRGLDDQLDDAQRIRLYESVTLIDENLGLYAELADAKMLREVKSRLNGWSRYLEEVTAAPRQYESEYATQAKERTVLAFLFEAIGDSTERRIQQERLERADARLRLILDTKPFIWHESLAGAFPEDRFWWLYGWPRYGM